LLPLFGVILAGADVREASSRRREPQLGAGATSPLAARGSGTVSIVVKKAGMFEQFSWVVDGAATYL